MTTIDIVLLEALHSHSIIYINVLNVPLMPEKLIFILTWEKLKKLSHWNDRPTWKEMDKLGYVWVKIL